VDPSVAPTPDDMVIVKKRVSAFTGSDLRVVLRSGVVLSALRKAADKVHQITVLADCCADRDEEVHTVQQKFCRGRPR
jgi:nicotinamidase-related amidase